MVFTPNCLFCVCFIVYSLRNCIYMEKYIARMTYSISTDELKKLAREVRKQILLMSYRAQSAHTGGALSCVELLTVLDMHNTSTRSMKEAEDFGRTVTSPA